MDTDTEPDIDDESVREVDVAPSAQTLPEEAPPLSIVTDRKTQLEIAAQPLSTELEAVRERLNENRREYKRLTLREVELYVALGSIVCELIDGGIIPSRQQGTYLDSGVLGCRQGTATNARYAYRLHTMFDRNFATLQNWGPNKWRTEWANLNDTAHADREDQSAQREGDAVSLAHRLTRDLDRNIGYEAGKLLLQNEKTDWKTVKVRLLDAARPPRPKLSDEERPRGLSNFMADSGAYSAQQDNVNIDLDTYCDCLHDNTWIATYIALDQILAPEPDQAAEKSFDNYEKMCDRGLKPIPVVHLGESIDWVKRYLDKGCDYIALGGAADSSKPKSWPYYDECFRVIDNFGIPIKVHAFGVASSDTLLKFPFTSCDATSWIKKSQEIWDNGFPFTDLSRLGDKKWQSSLTYHQRLAAATYLEAFDANVLERYIQLERPDFKYYLGYIPDNKWAKPALLFAGHRSALCSYYYMRTPAAVNLVNEFFHDSETVSHRQYRIAQDSGLILSEPPNPEFQRTLIYSIRDGQHVMADPYALTMEMHQRHSDRQIGRRLQRRNHS